MFQKYKNCIAAAAAVLLTGMLLGGCAGSGQTVSGDQNSYFIYCLDVDSEQIEKLSYKPDNSSGITAVDDFMEAIQKYPGSKDYISAIPDDVAVLDYSLDGTKLTVNFSASYLQMETTREVLCRGACVLTLMQIDGVSQILFTVEGTPLVNAAGEEIGSMTGDTFIDNSSASVNQYQVAPITLYFAGQDGTKLIPYTEDVRYSSNVSIARTILRELMKEPPKGYYPVIPSDTKLLGVSVHNGICYVNFDSGFLEQEYDISDQVQIYAVVDSLIDGVNIRQVQISVNGDPNLKFHESISLASPLDRNLDIVEELPDDSQ